VALLSHLLGRDLHHWLDTVIETTPRAD
jgi:hypothetical protein